MSFAIPRKRSGEDRRSKGSSTPTARAAPTVVEIDDEPTGRHKGDKSKKGDKKDKDRTKERSDKGKRGHGGPDAEEPSTSHRRSLDPPQSDDRGR